MPIINKTKATTGAGSAALAVGELASNTADDTLYLGTPGGNVLLTDGTNLLPASGNEHEVLAHDGSNWVAVDTVTADVTGDLTGNVTGNLDGGVLGNVVGDLAGTADNALRLCGTLTAEVPKATNEASAAGVQPTDIQTLTQAEYDVLTKDANTLYFIVG